jgi:hypothetical protein
VFPPIKKTDRAIIIRYHEMSRVVMELPSLQARYPACLMGSLRYKLI